MECTSTTTPTTPPMALSSPTSAFNPVPRSHKHSIDFLLNPTKKEEPELLPPPSLIGRKRKAAFPSFNNSEETTVDSDLTRTYLFPHSPHVPHKKAMVIFHEDYTNPILYGYNNQTQASTTTTQMQTTTTAVQPLSPPVSSSSRSSSCKRRKTTTKTPAPATSALASTQQQENLLEEKVAKKQDSSKLADLLDTAAGPNLFQKIQALPETPVPLSLEAVLRSDAFFNFNPITGANDSECGLNAFEASFPSKKGLAPLKTRKRPNSYQRAFLEYVFRLDPWPDTASKLLISQKIQMTPQQINTWFQNKRARSKKTTPTKAQNAAELPMVFQQLLGIKG